MTVHRAGVSSLRSVLASPGFRALAAVAFVAAAVRMALVVRSPGGFGGDLGYDPSVYYAAGDALIHGRLPYGDFTLLHPPGLMLALAPFAAFGALTTDHLGFLTANIAFELLGAVNAALVVAVARRYGVGHRAAIVAGLVYATWYAAAHPEVSIRLEPAGTALFLTALLLLGRDGGRRRAVVAGLTLGAALTIKIWWIVPVVAVIAWTAASRTSRHRALPLLAGIAAAAIAIDGPFFLAAPSAMWRMVVTDQLGRGSSGGSGTRIGNLSALTAVIHHGASPLLLGLIVVVTAVAFTLAWQVRMARLVVLVAALQLAVLFDAPSFFAYYAGYVTATFCVVLGAALTSLRGRARTVVAVPMAGLAALTTVAVLVTGSPVSSARFPTGAVTEASEHVRCVMSDDPEALIAANVLSRDLANGCPNWVDVTGRTYDVDASTGAHYVIRAKRSVWQRDLRRYLSAGQVIVLMRPTTGIGSGIHSWLTRSSAAALSSDGVHTYEFGRHDDHDGDGPDVDAARSPAVRPTP